MKIVMLDKILVTRNKLSLDEFAKLGELVVYDDTKDDQVLERIIDADIVIENKIKLTREHFEKAKNLKFISTFSTGFNLIDTKAAREHNIVVSNVPAYSSYAVAQSTIALMLEIANKTIKHNAFVKDGKWYIYDNPEMFTINSIELFGKTLGIIGMGDIGYKVAKIAEALGMKIIAYKRTPDYSLETENIKFASLDDVFKNSDFLSLHCPSTPETDGIINRDTIAKCKDGVYILNTSRGGLLNEDDVLDGLNSGKIAGIGVDVLRVEPSTDSVLIAHPNAVVTPHIAWAPEDTRQRLINIVLDNTKSFINGTPINVVN